MRPVGGVDADVFVGLGVVVGTGVFVGLGVVVGTGVFVGMAVRGGWASAVA